MTKKAYYLPDSDQGKAQLPTNLALKIGGYALLEARTAGKTDLISAVET